MKRVPDRASLRFRLLAAVTLVAGLSVAFSTLFVDPAGATSVMEFSHSEFHVGVMHQYEERSHTFQFKNTGDCDLVIEQVKSSCSCTATVASERAIPPGGTGEVTVTFNSKAARGEQEKAVTVISNASNSPLTLEISARIKKLVDIPRSVDFGILPREEAAEQSLEVVGEPGSPFELLRVETDAPFLSAGFERVPSREGEGRRYTLWIRISPAAPPGKLTESLRLFTNLDQRSVIEVPVRAAVEGYLDVSPGIVSFGAVSLGDTKEIVVAVVAPETHAIHITSVSSSIPSVDVAFTTVRGGHAYEVRCSISSELEPGRFRGALIIETDDPREARRELVLLGFVKG